MESLINLVLALLSLIIPFKFAKLFFRRGKNTLSEDHSLLGGFSAPKIEEKIILTDNEREFFFRLKRALPDFHIFPQVAASAILQVSSAVSKSEHYSLFGTFSQKRVDYVVCEQESLAVIAIIELDDRTHDAKKDQKRDALFKEAGYQVIRFESRRKPSEKQVADFFARLVGLPTFPPAPELRVVLADAPEEEETPLLNAAQVKAELDSIRQSMTPRPSFSDSQERTTPAPKDETIW